MLGQLKQYDYDRYKSVKRHWCPLSEEYTTGDALMTALDNGWVVDGVIFAQEFWLAGVRRTLVYHVNLCCNGIKYKMMVVHTPYVAHMVRQLGTQVVMFNQRKHTERERWY